MAFFGDNACHAWGTGNTSGTIASSYNMTSLTDNGTGDGTTSFTSAMSDANYAHSLGHRPGSLTSGSSNQRNMRSNHFR